MTRAVRNGSRCANHTPPRSVIFFLGKVSRSLPQRTKPRRTLTIRWLLTVSSPVGAFTDGVDCAPRALATPGSRLGGAGRVGRPTMRAGTTAATFSPRGAYLQELLTKQGAEMALSSTSVTWEVTQMVVYRVRRSNEDGCRRAYWEIVRKNASFGTHTEV